MDHETLEALKRQSLQRPLSRRDFVRVLTIAASAGPGLVAAGLAGCRMTSEQRAEAGAAIAGNLGKLPLVAFGTRLGGMKVTPLCIAQDWNSDLIAPAVEMGVNFVHKAGYWRSGRDIPEELSKQPRESYYTDITVDSTPDGPDDEDRAYNQVKSSLDKNGLKYYDIFRAHFGWRSVDDFKKKIGTYKAFQRLKREGLVKYFGVSQHGAPFDGGYAPYTEVIRAEIDSGIVDAMQVWCAYGYPAEVTDVFAAASKAGIAMTAMKIYAQGNDRMRSDAGRMAALKAEGKVGRACIRHVMSLKRPDGQPIFQTCVSNLANQSVFEENAGGVSPKVSIADGLAVPIS